MINVCTTLFIIGKNVNFCYSISMVKNSDFTKILRPYQNKWVALSPNRTKVLGAAENLSKLRQEVKDEEALFMKVLPHDTSFAF
jgi:hypothetical protein